MADVNDSQEKVQNILKNLNLVKDEPFPDAFKYLRIIQQTSAPAAKTNTEDDIMTRAINAQATKMLESTLGLDPGTLASKGGLDPVDAVMNHYIDKGIGMVSDLFSSPASENLISAGVDTFAAGADAAAEQMASAAAESMAEAAMTTTAEAAAEDMAMAAVAG